MSRAAAVRRRLVPAEGVRLKIVDDNGILFDRRRRIVYFLNTAATLIWCRIESGERISRAASAREIIARWRSLGLLVAPGARRRATPPPGSAARKPRRRRLATPPKPPAMRRDYRLLGTTVALAYGEAGLAELVHPTLAHLALDAPAEAPLVITIDRHGDRFRLAEGGWLLDACSTPSEITPLVKLHVARLAVARFPHRLVVHAGVLANAAGCVLLPAAAGSGKSVLSAALMGRGWEYLSDDSALLDAVDFSVTGVPYSLTIKEGGWDVVAPRFPGLLGQAVHRRPDRQRVRYLPPTARGSGAGPIERRVRWIAFPRYARSGPPAAATRLKRAEALRLLLANCGWVRPIDWGTINRTVDWLAGIESYRVIYSDVDAVAETIETWAGKTRSTNSPALRK